MICPGIILGLVMFVAGAIPCLPASYYVANNGNDANPGTLQQPFQTINHAASIMQAGDECFIRAGDYREVVTLGTSGTAGAPIRFVGYNGERPLLDGCDVLQGAWSQHSGNIYKISTDKEFDQVFVDDDMMVEARCPNMKFPDDLWKESRWAEAGPGSEYGTVVDAALAATNIDWTGARAVLNVAHQFYSWVQPVLGHAAGSDRFTYVQDLRAFSQDEIDKNWWQNDRYYLVGKLEALDSPGEWFLDRDADMLYVWLPEGDKPASHTIRIKQRHYAMWAEDRQYIEIDGLDFTGTAFWFENCNYFRIENCYLRYSSSSHWIRQNVGDVRDEEKNWYPNIIGAHNVIKKCAFAYGTLTGIYVGGFNNLAEDNIFHDFSWDGSLEYVGLRLSRSWKEGGANIARNNTVYNTGGPGLHFNGHNSIIEYNHIYDGLRARFGGSNDGCLLYTQGESARNCVIRYNWVHGSHGGTVQSNWGQGIGIRGDDATQELTVHHNVVWNCGGAGIVVKGDSNKVYHNTVLNIGRPQIPEGNFIMMPIGATGTNEHSQVYNNVARTITSNWNKTLFPDTLAVGENNRDSVLSLTDTLNYDFRPMPNLPLVDAGRLLPGYNDNFIGDAPDLGAYEAGGILWRPGVTWAEADIITGIRELQGRTAVPEGFVLLPNYPNPFNPVTTVQYQLPREADVKVTVYDVLGRRVKTLVKETQPAGDYRMQWNGNNNAGQAVAAGVYLLVFQADRTQRVHKMLLLK